MGHVPVPWYIGGEAITPDKVARLVSYMAAGGREGVLNHLDCRVLAQATPGASIRVMPGAYAINSRTHPNENYTGMVDTADNVATTATGSSGGRSDLVVVLVQNSNDVQEGWDEPADPQNGPYISTVIYTGVPATTTSFGQLGILGSGIALARIDFPPSTATVTQVMIKDLRGGDLSAADSAANGGSSSGGSSTSPPATTTPVVTTPVACGPTGITNSFIDSINCTSSSSLDAPAANQTGPWIYWPAEGSWNVLVPSWATEVAIYAVINPRISNSVYGQWRLMFNGRPSPASYIDVNYPGTPQANNPLRQVYILGGKLPIPAAERGKSVPVKTQAYSMNSGGGTPGSSKADPGTVLYLSLAFRQGAASS